MQKFAVFTEAIEASVQTYPRRIPIAIREANRIYEILPAAFKTSEAQFAASDLSEVR